MRGLLISHLKISSVNTTRRLLPVVMEGMAGLQRGLVEMSQGLTALRLRQTRIRELSYRHTGSYQHSGSGARAHTHTHTYCIPNTHTNKQTKTKEHKHIVHSHQVCSDEHPSTYAHTYTDTYTDTHTHTHTNKHTSRHMSPHIHTHTISRQSKP